jgi:hypothetical protein
MSDFSNQHVSRLSSRSVDDASLVANRHFGGETAYAPSCPAPKRHFGSKHGSGNTNAMPRCGTPKLADPHGKPHQTIDQ